MQRLAITLFALMHNIDVHCDHSHERCHPHIVLHNKLCEGLPGAWTQQACLGAPATAAACRSVGVSDNTHAEPACKVLGLQKGRVSVWLG